MQDILELHEFFVEGGNQERSHVLLHITEPDTEEEKKKGYFFAICEINNGSLEQIEHLQEMIDDLESGYYETEDETGKNSFETTLEFINRRGHHLLKFRDSINNCLVGVLRGHQVFFAYHGQPQAYLFYRDPNKELKDVNILEEQEVETDDQLFSSMLQGEINSGDFFFVATPHVLDYFSIDRIKKIIESRTTRQSVEHIEKVLTDLRNDISFGGVFFHFPTNIEVLKTGKQPKNLGTGSASSLNHLVKQEQKTAETLSPSVWNGIGKKYSNWKKYRQELSSHKKQAKIIDTLKQNNREDNFRPTPKQDQGSTLNTILISLGKTLVNLITGLFKLIKKILFGTGKLLIALILIITNKDQKRTEVIRNYREFFHTKKETLSEMPLSSKIIIIITILLVLIFIISLASLRIKNVNQAQVNTYNNQVQAVTDKINAAEASLLYNDENKATTLMSEAKNILNQLTPNSKTAEQKKLIENLQNQLALNLQKLRKMTNAPSTLIIDIRKTNSKSVTTKLAVLDSKLIAYGENDPELYLIDPQTKNIQMQDHTLIPHFYNAATPKENDLVIFTTGNNSIAEYDKNSGLINSKDIAFPENNVKINALFLYSRRLYIVDINNNQIYKNSFTQTGFDKGQPWLKTKNLDLKNTVSIAIDGDMYILKNDGQIIKLTAGEKQNFNIQNLDPALTNPVQIWTYNGVNNLYILEPVNKRIVILDKTGKLIKQLTSSEWQNPTSMIVDETKKTIFLLDDNKIYKLNF